MPRLTSVELNNVLEDIKKAEAEDKDKDINSDTSPEHTWCNTHQKVDCECDPHLPTHEDDAEGDIEWDADRTIPGRGNGQT